MHILACQPQTIFKNGNIEIDYFDKFRCLHLSWTGQVTAEAYRHICLELLQFTKKYGAMFWLFDARDEDCYKFIDPEWTIKFFCEEVSKQPVKKIARIAGCDFNHETRISDFISKLIKENNLPFDFKYQPDTNEALTWFLEEAK